MTIDNPTNLPPATEIAYMEEPMVAAQVITPQEYVGAIMELCQDCLLYTSCQWRRRSRRRKNG